VPNKKTKSDDFKHGVEGTFFDIKIHSQQNSLTRDFIKENNITIFQTETR